MNTISFTRYRTKTFFLRELRTLKVVVKSHLWDKTFTIWDYLIPVDRTSFLHIFVIFVICIIIYNGLVIAFGLLACNARELTVLFLSSFIRLPPPLRAFWESSFKYHSTVQLTEILYNTYSFLYFCRWARILRQSILGIFTSRFLKPGLSACVWPSSLSGTSSFILLWYSSIFPYLYFMFFLISICFKWLSNTYLTESSTAVIRYSSRFLTYAVIYDGRSRLIQMMKGNNSKYNKLQLLIPWLSRSYHSRLT